MAKIVIDPGHGGLDSGGIGKFVRYGKVSESELTLLFSNSAKNCLEQSGHEIYMLRSGNITLPTASRIEMVNTLGGQALLSIHFNTGGGNGTEVFYSAHRHNLDKQFAVHITDIVANRLGTNKYRARFGGQLQDRDSDIINAPVNKIGHRALIEIEFIDNPTAINRLDYPISQAAVDFGKAIEEACRILL